MVVVVLKFSAGGKFTAPVLGLCCLAQGYFPRLTASRLTSENIDIKCDVPIIKGVIYSHMVFVMTYLQFSHGLFFWIIPLAMGPCS